MCSQLRFQAITLFRYTSPWDLGFNLVSVRRFDVCARFLQPRWIDRLTALVGFLRSDGYSPSDHIFSWEAMLLNKVIMKRGTIL